MSKMNDSSTPVPSILPQLEVVRIEKTNSTPASLQEKEAIRNGNSTQESIPGEQTTSHHYDDNAPLIPVEQLTSVVNTHALPHYPSPHEGHVNTSGATNPLYYQTPYQSRINTPLSINIPPPPYEEVAFAPQMAGQQLNNFDDPFLPSTAPVNPYLLSTPAVVGMKSYVMFIIGMFVVVIIVGFVLITWATSGSSGSKTCCSPISCSYGTTNNTIGCQQCCPYFSSSDCSCGSYYDSTGCRFCYGYIDKCAHGYYYDNSGCKQCCSYFHSFFCY